MVRLEQQRGNEEHSPAQHYHVQAGICRGVSHTHKFDRAAAHAKSTASPHVTLPEVRCLVLPRIGHDDDGDTDWMECDDCTDDRHPRSAVRQMSTVRGRDRRQCGLPLTCGAASGSGCGTCQSHMWDRVSGRTNRKLLPTRVREHRAPTNSEHHPLFGCHPRPS